MRGEMICPCQRQFDGGMVQPPSEWFWSTAGNGLVAISATSGGSMAVLTSGFNFTAFAISALE